MLGILADGLTGADLGDACLLIEKEYLVKGAEPRWVRRLGVGGCGM